MHNGMWGHVCGRGRKGFPEGGAGGVGSWRVHHVGRGVHELTGVGLRRCLCMLDDGAFVLCHSLAVWFQQDGSSIITV